MQHNLNQLINDILSVLQIIKEDKPKLEKLHDFVMKEIYEEPEEMEKPDIPEKFKKVVAEVADSLTAGFVCFVNPDTLETEDIPQQILNEPGDFEAMTGESIEDLNQKHIGWEKCIKIEPPASYDSYKIMEHFAEKVPNAGMREKLIDVLNERKPFANFKRIIDNSDYRQDWFDFRQARLEEYVYEELTNEIEEE